MTVGHVAPPSGEHSTCVLVLPAAAASLTSTAPLSASTLGFAGAAGLPIGVTVPCAGGNGPSPAAVPGATSHWWAVPDVSPVTPRAAASDGPSVDMIQSPLSPARHRT